MAQEGRVVEGVELPPAGTYQLDLAHTSVELVARHMLTKVRGRFTEFSGSIEVAERPEDSTVAVEIKTASIQTDTGKRDEHLRSEDFLLIEKYPLITFTSTAVRPTGARSVHPERGSAPSDARPVRTGAGAVLVLNGSRRPPPAPLAAAPGHRSSG